MRIGTLIMTKLLRMMMMMTKTHQAQNNLVSASNTIYEENFTNKSQEERTWTIH
jgi:hypothetical protein